MKMRILSFGVIFIFFAIVWSKPAVDLRVSGNGYTLDFKAPMWQVQEVDTMGLPAASGYGAVIYSRVKIPDYFETDEIGKAELPALTFHMAISGPDQVPTFKILDPIEEHIFLNHLVYPLQPPWPKSSLPSERPFTIDKDYYNSTGERNPVASVSEPFVIRGVTYVTITITPFAYNPLKNELTIMKKFVLKINTATTSKYKGLRSKEFEKLLRGALVNFDDIVEPVKSRQKENYLIITAPNYESDLSAFVSFRRARFNVDLFTTDATGTSSSDIISFIEDRYDNVSTRPTFLLLVGDVDKIPASQSGSDLSYAAMESSDRPDIFVGRFSVSSSTELSNIITKTMYMENDLANIDKVNVLIGGADAGSGDVAEGSHNYAISKYFEPEGYENIKRFCNSSSVSKSDVMGDINDGVIFAIYSGHGGPTSWGAGDFNLGTSDFKSLTNTTSYPSTYSFACNCGEFSRSECLSEASIRAKGGSVASWASSKTTSWGPDDKVERGMVDAMADDDVTLVSSSFIAGLINNGSSGYFRQYNLMGDPAVETNPDNLGPSIIVDCPNSGEVWTQDSTVEITWSDNFEEDIKIELLKNGSVEITIENAVSSEGPYSWEIPTDIEDGTDFKIRITHVDDDLVTDESDGDFTINKAPEFTSEPDSIAVVNAEYIYEITADDGGDLSNLQFGIGESPSWLTLTDNGDGTATIKGTPAVGDTGVHNVVLTLTDGVIIEEIEQAFTITVKDIPPPVITAHPDDITVMEGETAAFSVSATGLQLSFQWQKDETDIPGATDSTYTTPETVPSDDGSQYRCIVSNPKASVESNSATLTVELYAPVITADPVDITITESETATFTVCITGSELSFQWQKDKEDIVGAEDSVYTTPQTTLMYNNSMYRCVVSNEAGSLTSDAAKLTVLPITAITKQTNPNDVSGAMHLVAVPNPAYQYSDKIHFSFYTSGSVSSGQLKVYDAVGNIVYETEVSTGSNVMPPWDLRNNQGKRVAGGMYMAVLKLISTDGTIELLKSNIGIKDN